MGGIALNIRKRRYTVILILIFLLLSTQYVTVTHCPKNVTKQMKFANISNKTTRNPKPLPLPLSQQQLDAINDERIKIRVEMAEYNFTELGFGNETTLDDLVMEKGGEPIRNFIIATWRSGSSFIASLVASHPATFFEFEPLILYDNSVVHPGKNAKEALQVLDGILSCNYSSIPQFDKFLERRRREFMFTQKMKRPYRKNPCVLKDSNFYSGVCRISPFHLIKTVRLGLAFGKEIIENKKHKNVRILLLVRDPRAIMLSRWGERWCTPPDCTDLPRLCMQMEEDFAEAELLREEFPDRFLALRYEDISRNPEMASKKILKFFRLQLHPNVVKFVKEHTTTDARHSWILSRDSRRHSFHWMQELHQDQGQFSRILEIQTHCSEVMEHWGYSRIDIGSQLKSDFVPLMHPPWPEMIISSE